MDSGAEMRGDSPPDGPPPDTPLFAARPTASAVSRTPSNSMAKRERSARGRAAGLRRELEALRALTDVALAQLPLDALLPELLERVTTVMRVDNAAILLLDESQRFLDVRAARGPEEQVAGQVKIPVGEGFAGRIAATRAPLTVEDISAFPVSNRLLAERLHSVMGVPLLVGGRALGVVQVGSVVPRVFTATEVTLLEHLADTVARAIERAQLLEREQVAREVAERRAAVLQATFEAVADGLIVVDTDGAIQYANSTYRGLIGGESSTVEALPRQVKARGSLLDVRDAEGNPLTSEQLGISRALRGERLVGAAALDIQVRRLNGENALLSVTGGPIYDAKGDRIGAVALLRDVTEQKRLEQRTHQALSAFLAITEALVIPPVAETPHEAPAAAQQRSVAYQLADLTCGVLGCSRVAISAVEGDELFTRSVAVVGLAPEDERRWWEEQRREQRLGDGLRPEDIQRLLAGEILTFDLTRPPHRAQPNPYKVTTVLVAPMWAQGKLTGVLALDYRGEPHTFTAEELDVTAAVARLGAVVLDRDRLLRERESTLAQVLALKEANRRMDEFLGIAGHELKTPLTTVKINLQLAERRARQVFDAAQAQESPLAASFGQLPHLLERATAAVDRQVRLVNDLLDTSRISADGLELRPEPLDLVAFAREVLAEQRLNARERKIQLTAPAERIVVEADRDRLGQVLTNYLTNAMKYSPPDRPITVAVRSLGASARVEVHDEGQGLTAEQQQGLFERFHRVKEIEVLSGSGVGLGLGLYISRSIIERHGGRVGVESASGQGATFWFTLPRRT